MVTRLPSKEKLPDRTRCRALMYRYPRREDRAMVDIRFGGDIPFVEIVVDWNAVWRFATATDERTWIGHGLQGFLFGFLFGWTGTGHGVLVTLGAFGHRESEDFLVDGAGLRDSYMDLWAPMMGAALGELAVVLAR